MKKILIAEDSTSWQNFHKELLAQYDKHEIEYEIYPCARKALDSIQNDKTPRFDLILSDLQMESEFHPEFAGEWFVRNIQEISAYKNTAIVIVSAAYNISFIAERLGVDYLSKRVLVSNPDTYFYMLDEHLR